MSGNKQVFFTIKGEIFTKQRPRATVIGGHARVYTPKDTINYENYIRSEYQRQCGDFFFRDKSIMAFVMAYFNAPESIKKIDGYNKIACCVNKDIDNILKIVFDSLNNVAYVDDKQIVYVVAKKYYSNKPYEYIDVLLIESGDISVEEAKHKMKIKKLVERKNELEKKQKLTSTERKRLEEINNILKIEELEGEKYGE